MTRRTDTIAPAYFDRLYSEKADPWGFRSSPYEQEKYASTLAMVDQPRYGSALEVGCSIGVFTRMLAPRCHRLLAIDASEVALSSARQHLADVDHVQFEKRMIPADFPNGIYDLIVLSEVVYYLTVADVWEAASLCAGSLAPGGEIILCHWLGETDYPLTGDEAADTFRTALGPRGWTHRRGGREAYRLDHLVRTET